MTLVNAAISTIALGALLTAGEPHILLLASVSTVAVTGYLLIASLIGRALKRARMHQTSTPFVFPNHSQFRSTTTEDNPYADATTSNTTTDIAKAQANGYRGLAGPDGRNGGYNKSWYTGPVHVIGGTEWRGRGPARAV